MGNRIFTNVILLLDVLHHTEEESNRVVITAYFQFPVVAVVLKDLESTELLLKEIDHMVALCLNKLPFVKLSRLNSLPLLKSIEKLCSEAICPDFVNKFIIL